MVKSRYLAKAIFKMLEGGASPEGLASRVRSYLEKNNLALQLDNILFHLQMIASRERKNNALEINSAQTLSLQAINLIKNFTKADEAVLVITEANKDLIGGAVAKYKGFIYDASVKTQIRKLKQSLMAEI